MPKLRVLLTAPLTQDEIQTVARVDPRLEVVDGLDLVRSELGLSDKAGPPWAPPAPGTPLPAAEASSKLDDILAEIEVILGWRLPRNLAARAPKLKWIQGIGAGIDLLVGQSGVLESRVQITNAGGLHSSAMREHVFWVMLNFARGGERLMDNQRQRRWQRFMPGQLAGKTLGIVGLGKIGQSLAEAGRAFNMKVVATKRSADRMLTGVPGVDVLYPRPALCDLLSASDYVVLSVPSTPETRHLIGEVELRAMKPTGYLINIARGPVVDEAALVRALKEGWIAGAGLDVFEQEPLPAHSELWGLPNVIISPHMAGAIEDSSRLVTALFCDNLRRYLSGLELINVVDKGRGY